MSITGKTIAELAQGLADKQFSSREITEAYLQRIKDIEPVLNAYITISEEQALQAAQDADARRLCGESKSKLDGIPIVLKDNICTQGMLTTCASKMLNNFIPPYNATCWSKLANAGAVLLAKANMDEFAMGSGAETSAYGPTHNPFNIEYSPGGSSGGSAAAVAADMCAVALGTDCGGGVRLPAHFCGVVGIKPSYGRISRYGIVPLVSSMDQAGLLAKSIEDAAMALEIIAGPDGKDVTLTPQEIGAYRQACTKPVKGLKVGLPREFLNEITAPPTMKMIEKAAAALCQAGAQVEEVDLPHTKYALSVYYILASAEASSNLARYDGVSFGLRVERNNVYDMISATRTAGFGGKAKLRILLGAYVTSAQQIEAYYQQALRIRTLIKNDYETVFAAGYDCLLTPVSMNTAFKLGEYSNDPLAMYITDFYTAPANLVGLPAMTVPYAMEEGLPMGLQLLAKPFDEETLFMVGSALEQPRFIPPDVAKQARQKGAV